MSTTNRNVLVDPARVTCLGNGAHAVVAVGQDGKEHLWLLVLDGDDGEPGCACAGCTPHEQPGRPAPVRQHPPRAELLRCGAPKKYTGEPCGTPSPGLVTAVITTAVRAVAHDRLWHVSEP